MRLAVIASIIFLFTFSVGAGTFLEDFDNGNLDASGRNLFCRMA